MTDYVVASLSGGKDSTAMVLHMIERGDQLDEVVTCDTGMEFPAMYAHLDRVRAVVEAHGIKYTVLKEEHGFEWYLLDRPVKSEKYGDHLGMGWPNARFRWCTKYLKVELLDRYLSPLRKQYRVVKCVGLAADEADRVARGRNQEAGRRHPLMEWGWTEADALAYCYAHGYDWGGLYEKFGRVSCWCCPLMNVDGLRTLHRDFPELWSRLETWEDRLGGPHGPYSPFKGTRSVFEMAARFEREAYAARCQATLVQFDTEVQD